MSPALVCALGAFVVLPPAAAEAAAAPTGRGVKILTPQVQRYACCELSAEVAGDWQNPFDPDQIDVSAAFTAPSGGRLTVPGFWYQSYAETALDTKPRERIEFLKFFLTEKEWPEGTPVEFFLDDVAFLDEQGREAPLDDMEQDAAPKWGGAAAAPLTWSEEVVHGGKRSLRCAPTIDAEESWPSAIRQFGEADWTRYRGVALWVYPRCRTPIGPVHLYSHDAAYGNSEIIGWQPGAGVLEANRWNRLEWRWRDPPPPIKLEPKGKPKWRVRFTPVETGRYRVVVSARQAGQSVAAEPQEFEVTPSDLPGFIRVSKDDPHYFVFDNGTPFFPLGHDVPWGLADVRAYFPKMKAHGENATYFILCPWDLSFEWKELGVYDLERAARLDRVFEAARQNGIYVKLSFDIHDALRPSRLWNENPYNAARGGPCAGPNDYWTDPAAWEHYRKRVRYIAARWGYSPNLMGWEPVAELDGATQCGEGEGWGYPKRAGGEAVSALLTQFLRKLGQELKTLDPYGRLFTTSYGGDTSDDNHWKLPEVQYLQIHCYDPADPAETLSRWAKDLTSRYQKPMMITEFGWGVHGPGVGVDPEGIALHNGIWASVTSGSAGGALNWWWQVIDARNLYRHFPPLRAFIAAIDWPHEGFQPAQVELRVPDQGRTTEVATVITGLGGFGDVDGNTYPVHADGTLGVVAKPPAFLLAKGRTEKRTAPKFLVEFPRPSTFAVDVGKVCPDARLEIRLDGKVARTVELPVENVRGKPSTYDDKHKLWVCQYDEPFDIDVPAGRHVIEVENAHPNFSWINARGYNFARQEPVTLRALGLTGRRTTILWIQNRDSLWTNWNKPTPTAITGAQLTLRGLTAGPRRVEWWDTWTGKLLRTAEVEPRDGAVTLDLPPVVRDVACRILQ